MASQTSPFTAALALSLLALALISLACCGGLGWFMVLAEVPDALTVKWDVPEHCIIDERCVLEVTVDNGTGDPHVVRDADLPGSFIGAFVLLETDPELRDVFEGAATGDWNLRFMATIEPHDQWTGSIVLLPTQAGRVSGPIEVCFDYSHRCVGLPVSLVVDAADPAAAATPRSALEACPSFEGDVEARAWLSRVVSGRISAFATQTFGPLTACTATYASTPDGVRADVRLEHGSGVVHTEEVMPPETWIWKLEAREGIRDVDGARTLLRSFATTYDVANEMDWSGGETRPGPADGQSVTEWWAPDPGTNTAFRETFADGELIAIGFSAAL